MPIRDHFRPPLSAAAGWEEIHTLWIANLTRNLNRRWLPEGFRAAPERYFGPEFKSDVGVVREPSSVYTTSSAHTDPNYEFPPPDATVEGVVSPFARVVVEDPAGRLVAVVELVSPANKSTRASRDAFAGKLESYLRSLISVVVVDLVTVPPRNLHNHWAGSYGSQQTPRYLESVVTSLYVSAFRPFVERLGTQDRPRVDLWLRPLAVGSELPVVPLFLSHDRAVPVELERTYLETCGDIRLPDAA